MVAEGYEHPTEFEVGTALAFLYFSREKVDYLLLEVGLGGAIDSTNVAPAMLSVITNVAMDHMDYLGHTIREIAAVKAGIVKPGVPVVTAAAGEGLQVIERVCGEKGCRLIVVGRDVTWEPVSHSLGGQRFFATGQKGLYKDLTIKLLGRHQLVNAATAVAAAENLAETGALISAEAVRKGLVSVTWPGRLEIFNGKPLTIIDGAHNYEGARSLKLALEDYFPGRDIVLVMGMLADKERARVVEELVPGVRAVVVTRPDSPRSGDWRRLADLAGRLAADVSLVEDVGEALNKAKTLAGLEGLVCVTGSLYMVAEAREKLLEQE
jgi:dihydrofolate synthase/folylpolyglutamate synthase